MFLSFVGTSSNILYVRALLHVNSELSNRDETHSDNIDGKISYCKTSLALSTYVSISLRQRLCNCSLGRIYLLSSILMYSIVSFG